MSATPESHVRHESVGAWRTPIGEPRPAPVSPVVWRVIGLAALGLLAVVQTIMAVSAVTPTFPYDEVSVLEMARQLAGLRDGPAIATAGYFPGWSVLIAPLWWISSDPETLYRLAIGVGGIVGIATVWPLALLARRWGLNTWAAVAAASAVMLMPSRAVQADYVFSERLLMLVLALLVLAAARFSARPNLLDGAFIAALSAACLFTHARAVPVAVVVVIWLLLCIRRRTVVVVLVTLGLTVVLAFGAMQLALHIAASITDSTFAQSDKFWDNLAQTRPSYILRVVLGQAWYQVVSSFGLIVIGALVVVVLAWREIRRYATREFVLILGLGVAMFALSVIAWSGEYNLFYNPWRRLDAWIYGRYFDPFGALIVLVGVVAVARGVSRRLALSGVAGVAIVIAPVLVFLGRQAPTWGFVTPAHIPGILPWAWLLPDAPPADGISPFPSPVGENAFWFWASACALAGAVVVLVLRRWTAGLVVLTVASFAAASLLSNAWTDRFQTVEGGRPPVAELIERATTASVDLEVSLIPCDPESDHAVRNLLSFWTQPARLIIHDEDGAVPEGDLVIVCEGWSEGEASGAILLEEDAGYERELWIMPGAARDELVEQGLIELR